MENIFSRRGKDTLGASELLLQTADTEMGVQNRSMTYSNIHILFLQDSFQAWHSHQYQEMG